MAITTVDFKNESKDGLVFIQKFLGIIFYCCLLVQLFSLQVVIIINYYLILLSY